MNYCAGKSGPSNICFFETVFSRILRIREIGIETVENMNGEKKLVTVEGCQS
jgi:hypothetical protein